MLRILISLLLLGLCACGGDDTPVSQNADVGVDSGSEDMDVSDAESATDATMTALLQVEPSSVSFGAAGVGTRSQRDLVFRNSGERDIEIIELNGLRAPFSISRSLPLRVPADAQRTVVVAFAPSEAGVFEQEVTAITDAEGVEAVFTLSGAVESADGRLTTSELNFGVLQPGASTSDFIQVENLSTATLTITAISNISPPFSVPQGQLPASAASMEQAQCLVNFAPEAEGDFEQTVTVRTNAGDYEMTLIGRALAPGSIELQSVSPAWAPSDEPTVLRVVGGPFPDLEPTARVGEVELLGVQRVDAHTVVGNLPADAAAQLGPQDVTVEFGPSFGRLTGRFIRTGPVSEGAVLTTDALNDPIGPEGNPWRIDGALRAENALTILAGTVLIGTEASSMRLEGETTIGDREGLVVFSQEARGSALENATWGGLVFDAADARHTMLNTVVEYGGSAETASVTVNNGFVAFEGLTIQASGHAPTALEYGRGAVSVVNAYFDNQDTVAISMVDAESIAQLSGTTVTSGVPVLGRPALFGRLPIGAGHDWSRTEGGIRLEGSTGTVRLANQPAGVYYTNGTLTVAADDTFTIPTTVPFQLTGKITVQDMGSLVVPEGGAIEVSDIAGEIELEAGAALQINGSMNDPLVLGGENSSWAGITVDGRIEGNFITLNGASLRLNSDFGDLEGLIINRGAAPLSINASGNLLGLTFQSDEHPIDIGGGAGRLSGIVDSNHGTDVRFADPELCAQWDLSGLRRPDNAPIVTNCP